MFDEHVKSLYDLAGRAARGRDDMKDAVVRGLVSQYHRVLRETPEVVIVAPLVAVRRQLSELSSERKRLTSTPTRDEVRQQNDVDALTKAMSAMAHGTMLWANEQLGLPTTPTAPTPPQTTMDASTVNYGEEQ